MDYQSIVDDVTCSGMIELNNEMAILLVKTSQQIYFKNLTPQERLDIIKKYCSNCGNEISICKCKKQPLLFND